MRPTSDWIREKPLGSDRLPAIKLGLTLPRSILYDRISRRVEEMVKRGWVEEVAAMLKRHVTPDAPAFQAIGYRQIVGFVLGDRSLQDAVEDTIRATRRYAKRQLTWFRKERDVTWIPVSDRDRNIASLLRKLKRGGVVAR